MLTNPNLEQESFNHKVACVRELRGLLVKYVHWIGGEALVEIGEAIAEIEGEIEEMFRLYEFTLPTTGDRSVEEQIKRVLDRVQRSSEA